MKRAALLRVICERTGKLTFGTFEHAQAARYPGQRVYRCEFCGFYHHTLQAFDGARARRGRARRKRAGR